MPPRRAGPRHGATPCIPRAAGDGAAAVARRRGALTGADAADIPLWRALLPAAFLPGAHGAEAGADLTPDQAALLDRLLQHPIRASRHAAQLILSEALLAALFDPAGEPAADRMAAPALGRRGLAQEAVARTIAARGFRQRTMEPLPEALKGLLVSYGLPPDPSALLR